MSEINRVEAGIEAAPSSPSTLLLLGAGLQRWEERPGRLQRRHGRGDHVTGRRLQGVLHRRHRVQRVVRRTCEEYNGTHELGTKWLVGNFECS